MSGYPNIYAAVVFDLHPKVRAYIEKLDAEGQIDRDSVGYPYVISTERQGPNQVTKISRNNQVHQFVLNPRKRVDPICSWQCDDGFVRPQQKLTATKQPASSEPDRRERAKRIVPMETFDRIVESIFDEVDDKDREINGWRLDHCAPGDTFLWEATNGSVEEKFFSYEAARAFCERSG